MSLKKQAIDGVIWSFAQKFSVQLINFGVQIVLARLLLPEAFGLIAMLRIFIDVGQMLMDGGMTSSLIRTKKPDHLDYSTVFVTNFLVSILVYGLVYLGAPYVADFYGQEILKNILRVYALAFVISSFIAVHIARLTKEMDFKTQMKLQMPSVIVGGIVGVLTAYLGYGVWSLVWLNLTQTTVYTIQCWTMLKWKPTFSFDKTRFKFHFTFGYKMTLASFIDTAYVNIYNVVVGKFFSPTLVGYFNQAETMRKFPVEQLSAVMQKVTYPLFANLEGDIALKNAYRTTMKLVFFAVVPMMMILIVGGKELFVFLFGEKWLPAVPFFQVLAFISITAPLSAYNLNILKVKGRSDMVLIVEFIKKSIGFIAVFTSVYFGMDVLIYTYFVVGHTFMFINMIFSGRYIKYYIWDQLKDLVGIYIIGIICLTVTYFFHQQLVLWTDSAFLILVAIALLYSILYLILIYLFEKQTIQLLKKVIQR